MSEYPDIPIQYKPLVDRTVFKLIDAAEIIWPIIEEVGCDEFEVEGEKTVIKITKKGIN